MNNEIHSLKIPLGYQIVERIKLVDLYTAQEILRSRKQRHITVARRTGYMAELVTHYIKCPHCGEMLYAYPHYYEKNAVAYPKKSKATIWKWSDVQPSLEAKPDAVLQIQLAEDFSDELICPECGYSSHKSDKYTCLDIDCAFGKLVVKREIKNLSDFVSMKWLSGTVGIGFPVYEQIVFDVEKGEAYIQVLDKESIMCTTQITDSETDFSGDVLVDLLSKNNIVKRKIKNCLEELTGYKMPFTTNELDIDKLVNFVRFSGFPKDFYESIPFWRETRIVDESFKELAGNLRNPESAMQLLKESTLPYCKSVKRLFAKRSGLFFYLSECEFLFSLVKDVNILCTYLKKVSIFHFLSMMHYYDSSVKVFLKDYLDVLGQARFNNTFSPIDFYIQYSVFYGALSLYVRKKEHKKWLAGDKNFDCSNILPFGANNISVIFRDAEKRDMVVNKYRFKNLRTKRESFIAGEKMQNCLVNWDTFSNPVAIVYKGDEIVAAVEFFNDYIVQAKQCRNKLIEPDSDLGIAIEKWCKINNIEFDPDELDDMPF